MQKTEQSIAEQLNQARKAGLEEVNTNNALCPHGRVAGMDVFSWVNPNIDSLNAMIASMPYKVIWAATTSQAKALWELNGEALNSIETLVVYNSGQVHTEKWFSAFDNVLCVQGADHALILLDRVRKEERTFVWTLPQDNWKGIKTELENHLQTWK
ncbi:MAG: hypothetical protein HRT58_18345 [Crocinitomicaceae bacterium]|nr:hypothetical protein [Flavobacteriales bacterium]NQZ37632.1 hypothetical protein [Crocinitomicaceae bacterium]